MPRRCIARSAVVSRASNHCSCNADSNPNRAANEGSSMSRRWRTVGLIALLVVATGGFYVARNPERDTVDDSTRKSASGKFVRLSDGFTHYELSGPDSGRAIVLVHGFSVPYYIWDSTAAALSGAGRRVLRYDQFGRGLSDRPTIDYTAAVYDRQLGELLDSLHIAGPADPAGVS